MRKMMFPLQIGNAWVHIGAMCFFRFSLQKLHEIAIWFLVPVGEITMFPRDGEII